MKKICLLLLILLFSFFYFGCSFGYQQFFGRKTDVRDRAKNIKELSDSDTPSVIKTQEKYSVLLINDIHFGRINPETDPQDLYDFLDSLIASGESLPAFIAANGDITHHGIQSEYDAYNSFLTEVKTKYGIQVYSNIGNHDCFNDGSEIFLSDVFPYSSYYVFSIPKTSFYFLDTGNGTLGSPQLFDLEKRMKENTKEKIVFTHYFFMIDKLSLSAMTNIKERAILLDLFNESHVRFIGTAHSHQLNVHDYGNFIEVCNNDYGKHRAIIMLYIDESLEKISVTYKKIN